jgi:phosphate transport system substrate-binding protein
MKAILVLSVVMASAISSAAPKAVFSGSDTLAGAMTDAIIAAGMSNDISYSGGGSGTGEKNLVAGDQGIAPMSREIKPEALAALQTKGADVVAHVIALDGLSVFVNAQNGTKTLEVPTIIKIFMCEITKWEQIPNSGIKGDIHVFRRNDASGTTDAFKHFTGIKTFGSCVQAVNETADISEKTETDALAIGYSGLSGKVANNRALGLSAAVGGKSVMPTTSTIRNFTYPFARKLYVYEVSGNRTASAPESQLLGFVTDRSFMDPIVQAHEFVTID